MVQKRGPVRYVQQSVQWALDFLPAQPLFSRVPHDLLLEFKYAVQ